MVDTLFNVNAVDAATATDNTDNRISIGTRISSSKSSDSSYSSNNKFSQDHDTVVCVVCVVEMGTRGGHKYCAAGYTSTGGINAKNSGLMGDSPILGSGVYAAPGTRTQPLQPHPL